MSSIYPLKSTIGQPATGCDRYFDRPAITKKIQRVLGGGSHILISAPRRIGKSSILKNVQEKAQEEIIIYLSVQSASSSHDFFHAVFKKLVKHDEVFSGLNGYKKRASSSLKGLISRIRGISVEGGLEIDKNENIQYYAECQNLINELGNKKVVLLVDEFPDAVNNMIRVDKNAAINFLLEIRELRQISSRLGLQFVFTGSSGLANVVSQLGDNGFINDLVEIKIQPYTVDEASIFIQCLALGYQEDEAGFELNDGVIHYILGKISWYLPYYLQIIVKELFEYFEDKEQIIDESAIDYVLAKMIEAESPYFGFFENWELRLGRVFTQEERQVAIEILNQLAREQLSTFEQMKVLPLSIEPKSLKRILNVLVHDGYISENQKSYGFNSFLLKQWWLEHVAV